MKRVLHVVSAMNRGGLETFIMNAYRNIDRNKIQFDFLVHTDKDGDYDQEIRSLGGTIYHVPSRNKGVLKNHKAIDRFFKNHPEYQVVHQHVSSLTYIEPLKAAKRHGVPTRIVHSHSTRQGGNFMHRYIHLWNRFFIKNIATDFFACSDLAAEWLYGKQKYRKDEYTLVNNGIDTEKYKFNEQVRLKIRRDLNIENKFVIGHVGRFAFPKNHDFLIEIYKAVSKLEPESVLLLVGDGELRDSIEKKCNSLGLGKKVIFTGVRSDIPDLLQAMDVFVMPSHYEGLPVTLVEAQASGLMCVVSNNITNQINITELINKISLESSAQYWANFIINSARIYKRNDTTNLIKDNGFDSSAVVEKLMESYTAKTGESL